MLNVFLSLDRGQDRRVAFSPNQAFEPVLRREAWDNTFAVLPDSAGEVARYPEVENAVATIGHQIDPGFSHCAILSKCSGVRNDCGDGRVKPGHDEFTNLACAVGG
jgi:hypothetical protein